MALLWQILLIQDAPYSGNKTPDTGIPALYIVFQQEKTFHLLWRD